MSALQARLITAPRGYLSEEDKRKFTLTAGILGAIFLVAQFVVPLLIMMIIMPFFMFSAMSLKFARPEGGARWDGRIWYAVKTESPFQGRGGEGGPDLYCLRPGSDEEPEKVAALDMPHPRLLAGRDRLWIVSDGRVSCYRGGRVARVSSGAQLGDCSPPFLYRGQPAVIEESPAGVALKVFSGGTWTERAFMEAPAWLGRATSVGDIRVLEAGGKVHSFLKQKGVVYHREGLPLEGAEDLKSWKPVCTPNYGNWTPLEKDGKLVLFYGTEGSVVGTRYQGGAWRQFFSHETRMMGEMGAFPADGEGSFHLLTQSFPGSIRLLEVKGGQVTGKTSYGGGFPFSPGFMAMTMVPHAINWLLPLLMAFILSAKMRRHRVCEYREEDVRAPFASLWRRALAQGIDGLILGGPVLLASIMMFVGFSDFEEMMSPAWMMGSMFLFLGGFVWVLLGLFVFSSMEGGSGQTPGKRAVGIRVVGTDLQPCGFGRALIRNLLKFVDGFFSFMVGILLVALTENWQRVGDMAARTVVITVDRGREGAAER